MVIISLGPLSGLDIEGNGERTQMINTIIFFHQN